MNNITKEMLLFMSRNFAYSQVSLGLVWLVGTIRQHPRVGEIGHGGVP